MAGTDGIPGEGALTSPTRMSPWLRRVGVVLGAACVSVCIIIPVELYELRSIQAARGGEWGPAFVDYFLPSPRAIAFVLSDLAPLWVVGVGGWAAWHYARRREKLLPGDKVLYLVVTCVVLAERALRTWARPYARFGIPWWDH